MNQERAALRGQIAMKEKELGEEKIKADGAATLLRMEIARGKGFETLDPEKIESYSGQLCAAVLRIKKLQADLLKMEDDLNG